MTKISPKNFANAIYEATEGKSGSELSEILKRITRMLSDKRMLGRSDEILQVLQNIIDEKSGTVRMKVTTARALNHETQKQLEHQMKEKYKAQKIISEYFEKEELLGGMRVEVGDEVLDTTYRNRLQNLEKFLMNK